MARRRQLLAVVGAAAGSALFIWAVRQAGVDAIVDGVRRVGWGLLLVLVLAGLRFLIRAQCWRLCMSPATRLTFGQAWQAFVAGDAVGSVTPLGLLASEPTKVFLTRHHLAPRESVASLALENLVYAASVLTMVAAGVVVVLAAVPLPPLWRWGALGALGVLVAAPVVAWRLVRSGTWDEARGARPRWREKISSLRRTVAGVSADQGRSLARVFGLDLAFHALAVVEVFVTLRWLMGDQSPTLSQAIAFEALNRVVTVVFKFVPFRIGVDEALTGALAPVMAVSPAAGVALAVVRKVRNLFWGGVGLAVTAVHPASTSALVPDRPATDPRGSASVHRS
jgi:hypothetical protein